jgi:sugar phosphate isomerase/epimerase
MDRALAPQDRLGLNVPDQWWAASPLLKEIEASGFRWVQLPSPPAGVLAEPRQCIRHASAAARSMGTTSLASVLHAPTGISAGMREGDRVLEGALSYAAECGAGQVVYHARAVVEGAVDENLLLAETSSLARLARTAERLGVTIALENLCPVFPGPQLVSAVPLSLRALVRHLGSPAIGLCLDLGHAHVIAELRHTALTGLTAPVLDVVTLFHVHDNLGARLRGAEQRPELDPLRLDLHLPPGRGTLPWDEIADSLRDHHAPLLLEVHPPHRSGPGELAAAALDAIAAVPAVGAR